MFRRIVATFTLILAASSASAQPGPQLLTAFPPGAKAGGTVDVTFSGVGFDGDEKLLFSAKGFTAEPAGKATVDPKAPKGQPAAVVKFKVTAPKDANGTFDVRVVSKSGLSNPRAFVVTGMIDVNETEPNNDVPQAQKIELETTVNGVISAPTDVDFVSFKAKAGQNVVVYCLTSSIDSRMQADLMVSGTDGKPLASNRGYRGGDAVLEFKAPTDGDYVVRVSQFAYTTGGPDHFYRLTATAAPWAPAVFPPVAAAKAAPVSSWSVAPTAAMIDLHEPTSPGGHPLLAGANPLVLDNAKNNTAADAQAVQVPCDVAGRVMKKNARHWYSFAAKKGDVWTLEVFAERIGSPVDAYLLLTDDKGKVITEQDDEPDSLSPNQFYTKSDDPGRYRFVVPADGTYKVMVSTREAGVRFGARPVRAAGREGEAGLPRRGDADGAVPAGRGHARAGQQRGVRGVRVPLRRLRRRDRTDRRQAAARRDVPEAVHRAGADARRARADRRQGRGGPRRLREGHRDRGRVEARGAAVHGDVAGGRRSTEPDSQHADDYAHGSRRRVGVRGSRGLAVHAHADRDGVRGEGRREDRRDAEGDAKGDVQGRDRGHLRGTELRPEAGEQPAGGAGRHRGGGEPPRSR